MRLINNINKLNVHLQRLRHQGKKIGFVPTMGYFHAGHLSLMKQAKLSCDVCVVSIYVNPKQFAQGEDLSRYPRDLARDSSLAKKENVDILFVATDNEMYPDGYLTYVDVERISGVLCGAYRPGHFRGVATIVAKLLNIVGPCTMYLGAKDAQQVVVLKRLVRDLNFQVKVTVGETIRETDGLALSSRNVYLNPQQRIEAASLKQALDKALSLINNGIYNVAKVEKIIRGTLINYRFVRIQYVAIVDAATLTPLKRLSGSVLIAIAAYVGKTRLIDNVTVNINEPKKN